MQPPWPYDEALHDRSCKRPEKTGAYAHCIQAWTCVRSCYSRPCVSVLPVGAAPQPSAMHSDTNACAAKPPETVHNAILYPILPRSCCACLAALRNLTQGARCIVHACCTAPAECLESFRRLQVCILGQPRNPLAAADSPVHNALYSSISLAEIGPPSDHSLLQLQYIETGCSCHSCILVSSSLCRASWLMQSERW